MSSKLRQRNLGATLFILGCAGPLAGPQKPQWMPGQMGMNAGILPDPGLTYVNITVDYSSGQFNGPNGKAIPATDSYDVWAVENGAYYVPNFPKEGDRSNAKQEA